MKNPEKNVLLASVLVVVFTGPIQRISGLYCATRLAGLHDAAKSRDGVYGCGAAGERAVVVCGLWGDAADFEYCLRIGGTRGSVATSLQHGARRRITEKNIWLSQPKKSNPIYNVWIVGVMAYIA